MKKDRKNKIIEKSINGEAGGVVEPTIDGKKLSEVFSDAKHDEQVKIEKRSGYSSKEFEINFDPNEDVKLKKKKSVLRKILACVAWVLIIVIGGAGGYVIGDIIIAKLDVYDPNAYSEDALVENETTINQWKDQNILSLSATQVFVVAEHKLDNCSYYSMTTKGYDGEEAGVISNSVAPQTLKGYRYVNGDTAYFNYFSDGIMPVVKRTEFTPGGDEYYTYNGSFEGKQVKWTLDPPEGKDFRTKEEYIALVGCDANDAIDYVVSRKTVLTESEMTREGDFYHYTITLSPKKSVANYVKKMKYMSGLADYPSFTSIEIDFVVDGDMNFQTIKIKESYKVNYGLTVACSGSFGYYFDYDDIEIL